MRQPARLRRLRRKSQLAKFGSMSTFKSLNWIRKNSYQVAQHGFLGLVVGVGEPQVPVGAGRDSGGAAAGGGDRELSHYQTIVRRVRLVIIINGEDEEDGGSAIVDHHGCLRAGKPF